LTFLGASLVTREGKRIKIDLLEVVLPRGWHPFREMLLAFLAALLTALLLAASLAFIKMEMSYGGHVLSVVPIWVSQAIIPIGFALMTFRFALRGLLEIVAIRRSRKP
jgi:TRAP-type C4-dicarboxylate transport system permease small subunit